MSWNRPSLSQLIVRIENDITSRLIGLVPLLQRALLKILARVFSGAFDATYGHQQFLADQITVGTASEEWLRRYAFQWDVPILDATFANAIYIFTGTPTTVISINTILVRSDGIEYITTATDSIGAGGSVNIPITCRTAGSIGNAAAGTPLSLVSPIIGVDTEGVMTGDGAEGGVDGDDIEEIRRNVLNRMKEPPMGGSPNDYKTVSEEVAGVERAFPFGNYINLAVVPGNVTVVIAATDFTVPGAPLLADVLAALNDPDFKPIIGNHFVQPIEPIDIEFNISIEPFDSGVQDNITQNLKDVFHAYDYNKEEVPIIPGGTILISHIRNAISTSGTFNYVINEIKVNAISVPVDQDISLNDYQFPNLIEPIVFSVIP